MGRPFGQLVQSLNQAADRAIQQGLQRRGFDVRPTHSAVLANIDIGTGTRATVLAERSGVTKQAIGQLVVDLEGRGFVSRVPDPTDRRAKLIQLTPTGQRLMEAAYGVISEIETELIERAGSDNVDTARAVLQTAISICSDRL